jgi:hypothetical protein
VVAAKWESFGYNTGTDGLIIWVHITDLALPATTVRHEYNIQGQTYIQLIKGKSSFMLRKAFWEHNKPKLWSNHFWLPSYCFVSVGGASLDVIKQYIENQRKPPSEK